MYQIYVSTKKNKKYDVYKNDKYLLSFGDKRYEHYKDTTPLRHYSNLDHNDEKRRDNFRSRFRRLDHENPDKAIYYSWKYLW